MFFSFLFAHEKQEKKKRYLVPKSMFLVQQYVLLILLFAVLGSKQ